MDFLHSKKRSQNLKITNQINKPIYILILIRNAKTTMNKIIIFHLLLLIVFSCSKRKESPKSLNFSDSINSTTDDYRLENYVMADILIKKAIIEGDTSAYKNLSSFYIMKIHRKEDLYFYALLMAEKHHYSKAYWDLFYVLSGSELCFNKKEVLDKLAVYYLLLAYEGGSNDAKYSVKEIFKGKKIPKSHSFKEWGGF